MSWGLHYVCGLCPCRGRCTTFVARAMPWWLEPHFGSFGVPGISSLVRPFVWEGVGGGLALAVNYSSSSNPPCGLQLARAI